MEVGDEIKWVKHAFNAIFLEDDKSFKIPVFSTNKS